MSLVDCLQKLAIENDERLKYVLSAIQIARKSGEILKEAFYKQNTFTTKADFADLVTETDGRIEKLIFDSLKNTFPSHKFIGEESATGAVSLSDEPTWIVDPIDGTTNFVHKNGNCATSIGLYINQKAEIGVVFAPILDEMYVAVKDNGAYLNEKKINILNPPKCLSQALVACGWGVQRDEASLDVQAKNHMTLMLTHKVRGLRMTGSSVINLCKVACGWYDLYVEYGLHCWDMAAACLMVEEAGGYHANADGTTLDVMGRTVCSAGSRELIQQLTPTLVHTTLKRDDE